MLDAFNKSRLSVKIALLGCSSVLFTTLLLLVVVTWQSAQYNKLAQNEVDKLIESDLNHITTGVYNLITAENEAKGADTRKAEPDMVRLQVRNAIMGITIGKTGYVYLLDTNGRYVISQHGERDGETILETRDSDGNYVIKDIIRKATAASPGELSTVRYLWQNPGEAAPRWKIARVTHFPPFNWIIGASVYEDELEVYRKVLTQGRLRMMDTMIIAGSVITLLFVIFGIAVARSIARPVLRLKGAVESVIRGELEQVLELQGGDEIGILAKSFNNMTSSLRNSLSELRETLDNLRESERQLKLAEEISHLGSWTFDLINNRLSWSDETFRIFGHAPQEFQPTHEIFLQAIHPDDREMVDSAFSESLHGQGNQYDIVHRIIIKSTGEVRTVREKCMHSRDAAGRIARSTGMVLDITEHRAMEEELHMLNAELEKRVTLRTAELERLNRELESFCYSISHEIRAPIARLTGFSRAISESVADADIDALKHLAERTEVASERLRSVIDALLTKNRLSRAKLSLEQVDLSSLCEEIVTELRETTGEREMAVTIDPGATAYADRQMIRLCLKQLLANAMKYTSRKPKTVIEFGRSWETGSETYFIRDNGDGFDMEFADKLFKPFSRLHNEEEFEGSGFGLALVHEVIERHKGRIWAQSSPGNGATFFFTLGTQSPG